MVIELKDYLIAKSELEKEYYVSRIPGDPKHVSLKQRPKQPASQRKTASESLAVQETRIVSQLAKAEYHDPAHRREWELDYDDYRKRRKASHRDPNRWNTQNVSTLWLYILVRIRQERLFSTGSRFGRSLLQKPDVPQIILPDTPF